MESIIKTIGILLADSVIAQGSLVQQILNLEDLAERLYKVHQSLVVTYCGGTSVFKFPEFVLIVPTHSDNNSDILTHPDKFW